MNKTMLSTALLTLLCATSYADNTLLANPAPAQAPAPTAESATVNPATSASAPAPQAATEINCKYRIPAEAPIDTSLLSTWAGKAAVQSFDYNPATIDTQLTDLKSCYTDQGWQGFSDALQKSGNVNAIKSQNLTVSSQVDGNLQVNPVKDNQWKVTVPLQVVYQNDKQKLTQSLNVELLIGRKISGDLGIMQMIATPRQAAGTQQPAATQAPSATGEPVPAQAPQPVSGQPAAGQVSQPVH